MNDRPKLNKSIRLKDFQDFYWLKTELISFCKEIGLNRTGGKIELSQRILKFLTTGEIEQIQKVKRTKLPKPLEPLSKDTVIGIDFRGYKEKKEYLQSIIGKKFHFTTHLLDWFKENTGKKTYGDLINEWYIEQESKKDPGFIKEIAPQFEYNTYIRDFLKDNPDKTKNDAIKYWKIKKSMRGDNKYNKFDLKD